MRHSAWLPVAVLSATVVCTAATRPRYGGVLRVEMHAAPVGLDSQAAPLASLVFEPLVRLGASGTPQPWLAVSWQHDASAKRWQFNLRPGVKFHDGFLLVSAAVAASLQQALPDATITGAADSVTLRAAHPMPDLLLDLAHNGLVFAHNADGGLVGTGPFRVTSWRAGRGTLAANDDYWGGRPYLDSIEIQMGRAPRDQLMDLEIGKADVIEVRPADLRRAADYGRAVWSSAPVRAMALVFAPGRAEDSRLRQALALSIDRAAMQSVLLQKQGEVTAALLPQWLSGYAFTFAAAADVGRARALATSLPPPARTLTLSYDPAVTAGRALAERVAVNARDAGLMVAVSPQNVGADVRLTEIRIESLEEGRALAGIATALGLEPFAPSSTPEALYAAEHKLLESCRIIPLVHLPDSYGVARRVRSMSSSPLSRIGDWLFEDMWLSGDGP